jgi:hypothetical protein
MANIRWDKNSDWDNNQNNTGINHSNDPYTTSSPQTLKQGYQKQWPPLTHGLKGWWPLHTDKPVDLSGNGNHGTLNGGVTTGVAGRGGLESYGFDGADDYVNLTSIPQLSSEWTISFWSRAKNLSNKGAQLQLLRNNQILFRHEGDGNQYVFQNDGNGYHSTSTSSTAGEWIFWTAQWDGSTLHLYKNASQESSVSISSNSTASKDSWIGAHPSGNDHFPGEICEVRVYDRALSASEIQTLYELGSADTATPPTDGVAYYKLDGDPNDTWNSNDGANNGAAFTTDAIRKQSGEFVASENDYIDLGVLEVDTNPITVSAWVKETTTRAEDGDGVSHCIVGQGWGGDDEIILSDNGSWFFGFNDTNGNFHSVSTSESYISGEWIHLIGVFTGTELQLYVNGTLQDTTSANVTRTDSTKSAGIGARYDGNAWNNNMNGKIDDVRIYDYALTPGEVHELYRYGTKGINMNKITVMQ